MCWKSSCACRLAIPLIALLALAGPSAWAQDDGRNVLRCTANAIVPVTVPTTGTLEMLSNLDLDCTGGPATASTSNLNLLINTGVANTGATGMPLLTITHDECSHLGQSILCPPGVPPGSNSLFFDSSSNAVFPGTGGGHVAVNPSDIFPYGNPPPILGMVSGNNVMWPSVPVDRRAKGRRHMRTANLRANIAAMGAAVDFSYPVFGTFTSSNADLELGLPSSLMPGTSNYLLGVGAPASSSPFCQSPLVISSGVTPFIVLRQVAVSGNPYYEGIATLGGPGGGGFTSLDIFAMGTAIPGSCQGSSVFNPANGQANLQNIQYLGVDYWGWANLSGGLSFSIVNYGTGTMPSR